MKNQLQTLEVSKIELDRDNPRIQKILEHRYKNMGEITPARIYMALKGGGAEMNPQASFERLKNSIKSCGGIQIPIIVRKEGDHYVCTEGNTRLAIYREFAKDNVEGDWSFIPCLVSDGLTDFEIEKTRITSHLVPPRSWPAYEKAHHLYKLRYEKNFDFEELINIMGGNKAAIQRSMMAYQDMRDYYIDKVDEVDPYRYSSFDELQKSNIKATIIEKGFSLDDFGQWVINDNFGKNENVRLLKKVLNDEKATEIFLTRGVKSIEDAVDYLKGLQPSPSLLSNATLEELTKATVDKISGLTPEEIEEVKSEESDTLWELDNLHKVIEETFFQENGGK